MKLLKSGIPFLVALVLLAACKDDENGQIVDTTPPVISAVTHDEVVAPGAELDLEFILEDNIALGEARIDIHDDFDDHAHEGGRILAVPFETTVILDEMRGKTRHEVHVHIEIPENAATGPYHLQINYTDDAGNEGELYIGELSISDPAISPAVNISNFGPDEELAPVEEEGRLILRLEGTVESRTEGGLNEVHITVSEEHDHESGEESTEEPLYDQEWELDGLQSFNLADIDPVIDLTGAEPGHYELRIMVRDVAGNMNIVTREVHID